MTLADITLPTLTGWIFYVCNLAVVSGYLVAAMLITRRRGLARNMTGRARLVGLAFLALCGLIHVELALHAFFNLRVINTDGTVPWHMLLAYIPQALLLWAFLWTLRGRGPRDEEHPT